jgi:hypothetical protein
MNRYLSSYIGLAIVVGGSACGWWLVGSWVFEALSK